MGRAALGRYVTTPQELPANLGAVSSKLAATDGRILMHVALAIAAVVCFAVGLVWPHPPVSPLYLGLALLALHFAVGGWRARP